MKVNIFPVIVGHLVTLSNYGEDNRSWTDYALFFGLPVILGGVLISVGFGFRADAVNAILTAFSIFLGLLLNVLVLVFTLASASTPLNVDLNLRRNLLREVFVNICFCILVSVAVVCTSLIALSYMRSNQGAMTGKVSTMLLGALTLNFTLTLLMIIKRMYVLLDKELERSQPRKSE